MLLNKLKQAPPKWQKELENQQLNGEATELVGSSKKMSDVFDRINKLSYTNTTVLIQGENGTGKELVARKIHQNSSHKHDEFIAINCAAVSSHLLETELFGHEKGTFIDATEKKMGLLQMANRGTLFLNEVSALSLNLQEKLLYVLENKNFWLNSDLSERRLGFS